MSETKNGEAVSATEIVAYLVDSRPEPGCLHPHTPEHAAPLHQHGFPIAALVRQSDHLAAMEAAREAALKEATAAITKEVTHLERDLGDVHQADGARRAYEAVRRLARGEETP